MLKKICSQLRKNIRTKYIKINTKLIIIFIFSFLSAENAANEISKAMENMNQLEEAIEFKTDTEFINFIKETSTGIIVACDIYGIF